METSQNQPETINPSSLELMQRAEIDLQVRTAKSFPRDLATVKKRMISFATLDEETAESCFYTLSRSGKTIQGPSVRLAEIAVACYGNLRAASRVIANDGRTITCQAACHDLENNTLISVEVQRRITGRDGKTYNEDMQVVAGNAGNAIAFRNAVFKVVPGALVKPVFDMAKRVAVGDASTLKTRRAKIIAKLNQMEVTTDRILAKLEVTDIENIDLQHLEILIGLGTAIKDGDTSVDEAFPPVNGSSAKPTEETREERQKRKMDEQAQGAAGTQQQAASDPPKQEAAQEQPKQEPTGKWVSAHEMKQDFQDLHAQIGEKQFFAILGANGIENEEGFVLNAPSVVKAHAEMVQAAEDLKPAEETKQRAPAEEPKAAAPKINKPVFGRPGRQS